MKRFSCMDCNCSDKDAETGIWMCMADPNWPAPCEYDDDYEEDLFNEDDPYVMTDPMAFY